MVIFIWGKTYLKQNKGKYGLVNRHPSKPSLKGCGRTQTLSQCMAPLIKTPILDSDHKANINLPQDTDFARARELRAVFLL